MKIEKREVKKLIPINIKELNKERETILKIIGDEDCRFVINFSSIMTNYVIIGFKKEDRIEIHCSKETTSIMKTFYETYNHPWENYYDDVYEYFDEFYDAEFDTSIMRVEDKLIGENLIMEVIHI